MSDHTVSGKPATAAINVIQVQEKSVLLAALLTLFLGPLGMLYSTAVGAIVMIVVYLAILGLSVVTLGMGSILFLPAWAVCIVWGVIAAQKRNRVIAQAR